MLSSEFYVYEPKVIRSHKNNMTVSGKVTYRNSKQKQWQKNKSHAMKQRPQEHVLCFPVFHSRKQRMGGWPDSHLCFA